MHINDACIPLPHAAYAIREEACKWRLLWPSLVLQFSFPSSCLSTTMLKVISFHHLLAIVLLLKVRSNSINSKLMQMFVFFFLWFLTTIKLQVSIEKYHWSWCIWMDHAPIWSVTMLSTTMIFWGTMKGWSTFSHEFLRIIIWLN